MAPATAKKPKKKNAPDKPMPEWMFPDDDKNPVLNRKEKSEAQILKEKNEWDQAVNFLQHKSVSAPLKPPPPALLLTLVGAFLTSYGFNSASRIYTTQLSSRKKLDDWKFELGEKLPKGFPDLVKIFKDWYKEYRESDHLDETSSEDDDNNTSKPKSIEKEKKKAKKKATPAKENSSSTSSGSTDSSSDESEGDLKPESAPPAPKAVERASNSASSSSSSSASISDSDADDEQETIQKPQSASSSSSDETSSSDDSNSSSPPPRASKTEKTAGKQAPLKTAPQDASRGTKKASMKTKEPILSGRTPKISTKSSTSSATLEISSPPKSAKPSTSSTSSSVLSSESSSGSPSSSDSPARPYNTGVSLSLSKRKRSASPPPPPAVAKKSRTPFQRVPKNTIVDERLASNAYVSHEYGDRAHQDLSVTRGKGFTKEKNKKKRGSYRGGAIDVGGGKGIKFED